jgi:hypothetical protein
MRYLLPQDGAREALGKHSAGGRGGGAYPQQNAPTAFPGARRPRRLLVAFTDVAEARATHAAFCIAGWERAVIR